MKIGAVSYLNTKPLIATLAGNLGPQDQLVLDLPSRLASRLATNEIDIGLIPVVEFFRGPHNLDFVGANDAKTPLDILPDGPAPEYRILSNAMIGCRGIVRSVRLFFRTKPEDVKTLAIDEGSKTSVALSKVLLADLFGIHPETTPLPIVCDPDTAHADAVLVIGDRAMHPKEFRSFQSDWDLGEKWYQHTGLPFVFAMWVGRLDTIDSSWRFRFETARDQGVEMLDQLSHRYSQSYRLSHADCMTYLGSNLRFTMEREDLLGMKLFYEKLKKYNLVPQYAPPIWPTVVNDSSVTQNQRNDSGISAEKVILSS